VPRGKTDDVKYYQDFERKLTPYLDPPPGRKVEVANRVMPLALDILRNNGYRFDSQLTLALKSMAQAEAITSAIVPDWTGSDFAERAVEALQDQALGALTFENVADVAINQASFVVREVADQVPSLQDGVLKWLGILKRGAVKVEVDTSALDQQIRRLQHVARTFVLGILIVGLIIGSAIAASTSQLEGSALSPVTGFAATVFTVSALVGGVWVVVAGIQLLGGIRRRRRDPLDQL